LRPGSPGPNEALVYLLPPAGEQAANATAARFMVNGQAVALQRCAPTCRSAQVEIRGGEHVDVQVEGPDGGTASFDLPLVPAPDGHPLFDRLQARMHGLRTLRIQETLGPVRPPVRTEYAMQAPDRLA